MGDPAKQPNSRYSLYLLFDEKLNFLKKLLFEEWKENEERNFEYGVTLLLYLLGFTATNLGVIKKLQDGPDIVANTGSGNIAAIECTIGLLDKNDKLGKLIQRTNLIQKQMKETGSGHLLIQPTIVTKLTKAEVKAHLEEAGKHGIAVICKEEIEDFLNRAILNMDSDRLLQEARLLIPNSTI